MKWISKRGGGVLLPKNDFQTGGLMEGRGEGGLLEEKWGLILRDFTLKQQSDYNFLMSVWGGNFYKMDTDILESFSEGLRFVGWRG